MNNFFRNSSLIVLTVGIVGFSSAVTRPKGSTEAQARKYIEHVVDTLLMPSNHAGSYGSELKKFTNTTASQLLRRYGSYPNFLSLSKEYNTDTLYNALLSEIQVFIEEKSSQYAQEELKNVYVPSYVDKQKVTRATTQVVVNEVNTIISKSVELPVGAFTNYVGTPLRNKVRDIVKVELRKATGPAPRPERPSTLYTTADCPVCMEDFHTSVKRIYLKCGHNICTGCLTQMYNHAKQTHLNCPLCRAAVSVNDYAQELWPASAPSW